MLPFQTPIQGMVNLKERSTKPSAIWRSFFIALVVRWGLFTTSEASSSSGSLNIISCSRSSSFNSAIWEFITSWISASPQNMVNPSPGTVKANTWMSLNSFGWLVTPRSHQWLSAKASTSNHSQSWTSVHPRTPLYLLCSKVCCTIASSHTSLLPTVTFQLLTPSFSLASNIQWMVSCAFGLESCDDSLVKELWEWGGSVWQTLNLCTCMGYTKILLTICRFIKHKEGLHRSNQSLPALHSASPQHHWLTTIYLSHLPDIHTIPLHLFEERVIMNYTENSILNGALGIVSYYLFSLFLMKWSINSFTS